MMSDALAAANIISGDLAFYRMMDGIRAARARRDYENEIAQLAALNEWLVRRVNHAVQAHNTLLAEANKRDAELLQRIADLERENAALRAEEKDIRTAGRALREIATRSLQENTELLSRIAKLEYENARLSTDSEKT
jgi:hypothetical protein